MEKGGLTQLSEWKQCTKKPLSMARVDCTNEQKQRMEPYWEVSAPGGGGGEGKGRMGIVKKGKIVAGGA